MRLLAQISVDLGTGQGAGSDYKSQDSLHRVPLLPVGLHVLKVPQVPEQHLPPGNQIFAFLSLWWIFYILTGTFHP